MRYYFIKILMTDSLNDEEFKMTNDEIAEHIAHDLPHGFKISQTIINEVDEEKFKILCAVGGNDA